VSEIVSTAVGLVHVWRDSILELACERTVTRTLRIAGSQHVSSPPGDAEHVAHRPLKHFGDLWGG
jgi:hypothetical protein